MADLSDSTYIYSKFIDKVDINVLRKIAAGKHYTIFDKCNDNLNIWGVRCDITDTRRYNDLLLVFYKHNDYDDNLNGSWRYDWFTITTDPSDINLIKPVNAKGCAVLAEGQFKGAFRLGKHKGDYDALVQNLPLPLYRANRKDGTLDLSGLISYEMAGINIHRASKWKVIDAIGLYSAGCQVFKSVRDYEDKFMPLVKSASIKYGSVFTYTLININDIKQAII